MPSRRAAGAIPKLPRRRPDTHKGDYGRILIVAGSAGMCGAAVLAGDAAYRSGAGLVFLAVPATLVPVVSSLQLCAVVRPLPDTGAGSLSAAAAGAVVEFAAGCDVLAIGPGLGARTESAAAVASIVRSTERTVVLDADGLNAFAGRGDDLRGGRSPRILTPHPGELSRLLGRAVPEIQADREGSAREAARRLESIVVLKGHRTVVTDGRRVFVNRTGNPGMASGGTGDVLTGVIAALVGQKLAPWDAACLGVHVHGLAGDLAAREIGEVSLMATDVLSALAAAFRRHQGR